MVDPGRRRRRLAPVAAALALWAALPSYQWCPFSWEECLRAREAAASDPACASACDADASSGCGPVSAAVACPAPTAFCAGAVAACVVPCDPSPDPIPLGDRAYCFRTPMEGVPSRGLDLPLAEGGSLQYASVDALELPPPPAATAVRRESAAACPAIRAPHAPPQSRAPPLA